MLTLFLSLFLLVASIIGVSFAAHTFRLGPAGGSRLVPLANVGEGWFPARKTYKADAAISPRYLLVKMGSDASHIAVAGASDIPLGIATDEPSAAEDIVNIDLFGPAHEGKVAVAGATISAGDFIVAAAGGKVRTLPVTSGTYYIVGRALTAAAADGDIVQFVSCFPTQRVV